MNRESNKKMNRKKANAIAKTIQLISVLLIMILFQPSPALADFHSFFGYYPPSVACLDCHSITLIDNHTSGCMTCHDSSYGLKFCIQSNFPGFDFTWISPPSIMAKSLEMDRPNPEPP